MRKALSLVILAASTILAASPAMAQRGERSGNPRAERSEPREFRQREARPQPAAPQAAAPQRVEIAQRGNRGGGDRGNRGGGGGWNRGGGGENRGGGGFNPNRGADYRGGNWNRNNTAPRQNFQGGGQRQEWRQGNRDDRREWRQDNRNDQREWRQGDRNDRREWRQDNRDDRRNWQQNNRNDRRWNNNGNWNGNRNWNNNRGNWNRGWRNDNRYDWQRWRYQNRNIFRLDPYYSPYNNWGYRRFGIGIVLDNLFWGQDYWINDPWTYRLPPAEPGLRWVRYYNDVMLVDTYSGEVVDVIYDFFW